MGVMRSEIGSSSSWGRQYEENLSTTNSRLVAFSSFKNINFIFLRRY